MMYAYIMERTQIYLTESEVSALDRLGDKTGRTRSQLIREAIDAVYLNPTGTEELLRAVERSAGAWRDATETGEAYVKGIRPGIGQGAGQ